MSHVQWVPRSPRFYQAALNYAAEVVRGLQESGASAAVRRLPSHEWIRLDDGNFARSGRMVRSWRDFDRIVSGLRETPAYQELLAAINSDPVVASHIDRMVGAVLHGARRIQLHDLTDRLIARYLERLDVLMHDEQRFRPVYRRIEDYLHSDSLTFRVLAPINGLQSIAVPVELEEDIVVDRFDDEEIGLCLESGFVPPLFPGMDITPVAEVQGLRLTYSVRKRVAPSSDDFPEPTEEDRQRGYEEVLSLGYALRILKPGRFIIPGQIRYQIGELEEGLSLIPLGPQEFFSTGAYGLGTDDRQQLQALWYQLKHPRVSHRPHLLTAVRRFADAPSRQRFEDRLVDLVVAAEALLLGGDMEADRGENAFRLSLRFALFSSDEAGRRLELLRQMRRAYRARNIVVHGGASLGDVNLGQPHELQQFVELLDRSLRPALRRMVELAARRGDGGPLVDWDTLAIE